MSGGHFDYQEYRLRDMADTVERDIARALRPKPAMVHEDYWTIDEMDRPHSYHSYRRYQTFGSYEEAESYLLCSNKIKKASPEYVSGKFFKDGIIFQSTVSYMDGAPSDELIPVLYRIHHCVYDRYPYDADVLELSDRTIEIMKEAYRQLRMAEIYAHRVDYMMSSDDSEDTLQRELQEDLKALEDELQSKDWSQFEDDEDD